MHFGVFLDWRGLFAKNLARGIEAVVCALALLFITRVPGATLPSDGGKLSAGVLNQIAALEQEKAHRTSAEQKIDSNLLFACKMSSGLPVANGVRTQRVTLDTDTSRLVLVDIDAKVTQGLTNLLQAHGQILSVFPQYHAIRARIGLGDIGGVASRNEVHFIRPAVRAMHNRMDSEGDVTHQANLARQNFGVDGTGVKVGVLSDSVDYLAKSELAGRVTVLPGQAYLPGYGRTGEGTAMLEIINDLAPGATLYFATAEGGEAGFAYNIVQLRAAGCDIIVDDVAYFDESPFQDGLIAQAVDAVTADGGLYFSAAGNLGNKYSGTAGTWEGDFSDGGQSPSGWAAGRLHNFGGGTNYNVAVTEGEMSLHLFWADPLKHSTNDYDLFVLDPAGNQVVASSTTRQAGSQDPYEHVDTLEPFERVVIVKAAGAGRFLHLDLVGRGRGILSRATQGQIRGHCCSPGALAVAAVNITNSYPNAFTGRARIENFSSDGPRRIFFHPDGTAITPGNYTNSGGMVLQKPDIAAADGVTTDFPPAPASAFNPFLGTSAAAPHAAAIAALVKSYNPTLSPLQVKAILADTALDIMAPGIDRDSGAGIVMALPAVAIALSNSDVIPIVQMMQPSDGSLVSGKIKVEAVADAITNLLSMALFRFTAFPGSAGYSLLASNAVTGPVAKTAVTWDTTTVSNGYYALFAVAYDQKGNEGYSQIINVLVLNGLGPNGGGSFGNYVADPLWQAAEDEIEQLETILDIYLNQIAVRNSQIIAFASQQSSLFGHPVKPQLVKPDQHWIEYINGQIEWLQARQYQIQLEYFQP